MRWKYFTGRGTSRPSQNLPEAPIWGLIRHEGRTPPPFFCKCVKRKGFKSFVLKVCDSKGVADQFLRKCVKRKSLGAMWGLLGICDRYFGSLRSLRTTILVGWSFWPRLRFLGPFYGPCFSC